eukprot:5653158-Pyramimonas_sp.AAC.1
MATQKTTAQTHHVASALAAKIAALADSVILRLDLAMMPFDCGRCGTLVNCANGLWVLVALEAAPNSGALSVHHLRACCPGSTPSNLNA